MKRITLNVAALAVIFSVGPVAFSPQAGHASSVAESGGICCDQSGATCHMNLDGVIISQPGAYYSSGSCS